ncbi:nitrate reductase [Delftia sp. 670]|uniref:nitrate reductase molybdenum cofactor assembly chaperone n=1 Tax=Delftia TaxID=80865 RepID=UPI0004D9D16C|nr:nitrate reductase molybdenum cofactor assembly chaperone [Delftia lacustris]KEH14798.1 nitrate reductase [Delftia sp. 670]BDE74580.1 nitrate reductase molybdenum cofactor assembly chaperone [Delftia lacustris]
MFNHNTSTPVRLTLRALACLIGYPGAELRALLPGLIDALRLEQSVAPARLRELQQLAEQLQAMDPFEAEARYVDTFDRGHQTSLHLFEHVHGDSADRGPALIDLQQTYERAGLAFEADELPDHLAVVLEFASTQPPAIAREFLGEMAHILNALFTALVRRDSPYASVIAAVLEITGHRAERVEIRPEPAMDDAWAEPAAFDGCSSQGKSRPGAEQPVHFVRRTAAPQAQGPRQRSLT